MKFNIGDKFYLFNIYNYSDGFEIRRHIVKQIKISGNNMFEFAGDNTYWLEEKDCLTKEELLTKLNAFFKKF